MQRVSTLPCPQACCTHLGLEGKRRTLGFGGSAGNRARAVEACLKTDWKADWDIAALQVTLYCTKQDNFGRCTARSRIGQQRVRAPGGHSHLVFLGSVTAIWRANMASWLAPASGRPAKTAKLEAPSTVEPRDVLDMYLDPQPGEVAVEEFERFALDRLRGESRRSAQIGQLSPSLTAPARRRMATDTGAHQRRCALLPV